MVRRKHRAARAAANILGWHDVLELSFVNCDALGEVLRAGANLDLAAAIVGGDVLSVVV